MKFEVFGYTVSVVKTEELYKGVRSATDSRTKKAKEKIVKAVEELGAEGKNITVYSVSKKSGVSTNTIKKYKELLNQG